MVMAMTVLDIDLLRALVAVVDADGFTAAADTLARTQSAISMQIRRLESTVGCQLLSRSKRGVMPTVEGEHLLGHARRILAAHDEAVQSLTGTNARGRVSIGTPDDYAGTFLTAALARFAAAHPGVELEIHCDLTPRLRRAQAAGELQLVLGTRQPGETEGDLLRREPMVWAAAPDHRPELRDPLPIATFLDGCIFRPLTERALAASGRAWRVAYSSSSLAGIQSAVEGGLALTALVRSTVPAGWRLLGLAEGLAPLPPVEIALFRSSPLPRAARLLADHLQATLADSAAEAA